jgi:purine nucleoside permease
MYTGREEGQQAAGWDRSFQAWEGAMVLCSSSVPSLTLHLGPDRPSPHKIIVISMLQFQKQQNVLWSLNFSFKISYTFGLSINFPTKY